MLIARMMPKLLQGQLRKKFYLCINMMSGTYHRVGTTLPSPYALFLTGNIVLKFIYIKNGGNVKKWIEKKESKMLVYTTD